MIGQPRFPAVTTQQMAEVDRLMVGHFGISLLQMMENAGRNLAEQSVRMLGGEPAGRTVAVLSGPGNNGGGGMAAARHLHSRGAIVQTVLAAEPDRLKPAPQHQWHTLDRLGLAGRETPDLAGTDLIVDALIGYGLRGEPRPEIAGWIERANAAGSAVLALDTPSGLDATSGRPAAACIRATATLTLALPKTGLLAAAARPYVGDLYVADIGVPPEMYKLIGVPGGRWFAQDSIVAYA